MTEVIEPKTPMSNEEVLATMHQGSKVNKDAIRNNIEDTKENIIKIFETDQENAVQLMKSIFSLQAEVKRLKDLCKKHNIDPEPLRAKQPNRAERRKVTREQKKAEKKTKKS